MSSIWKNEPKTNELRQEFIKTCKAIINITFEGGFAKRTDGDNFGFDKFVIDKRADQKTYEQKIQKSAFVFNTPAVLSCHGWKLAEFLALGKAIISTKHVNTLPLELEDNKHLIYVNQKSMMEKCQLIVSDSVLKQNLEKNARQYFLSVLAPAVVIKKLIAFK
jgi:glycosyltransferase involved in cell wall biosynthesis